MGNGESLWRKIHAKVHRNREVRVLILGLNDAGKTTILYKLKVGKPIKTTPTMGFNVETITYKGINFTTWDVSGRSGARALWHYYYPYMDALMLVVDSNDRERIEECRDELSRLLCEDELKNCCLLVMANKQDLPNAMSLQEVTEKLNLDKLPPTRTWYIQDSCATTGEGLYEGLSWVKSQLTAKHVKKTVSQSTSEESLRRLQSSCLPLSSYFTRTNSANATDTAQLL